MGNAPYIEYRDNTNPATVLTSAQITGTGYNGSIPTGSVSNSFVFRIYNNYAAAANVGDALNCVLAAYDSASNQGAAITTPVQQAWIQVEVTGYNGSTTNADTKYAAIGGTQKHPVPTNSGTLPGASNASSYITISLQIVVPSGAPAVNGSAGLFLEYSWV